MPSLASGSRWEAFLNNAGADTLTPAADRAQLILPARRCQLPVQFGQVRSFRHWHQ